MTNDINIIQHLEKVKDIIECTRADILDYDTELESHTKYLKHARNVLDETIESITNVKQCIEYVIPYIQNYDIQSETLRYSAEQLQIAYDLLNKEH